MRDRLMHTENGKGVEVRVGAHSRLNGVNISK